jgi:hypothetical protein
MYLKISTHNEHFLEVNYDLCIIGAGAAGLYLASKLMDECTIAIVEAGGMEHNSKLEESFSPNFSGEKYSAASKGRAFRFGGTTTKWSGQLVPAFDHDNQTNDFNISASWDFIIEKCFRYGSVVRKRLIKKSGDAKYFTFLSKGLLGRIGYKVLSSEWIPPNKRNLVWLIGSKIKTSKKSHVFLNTIACNFIEKEKGVVSAVQVHVNNKKYKLKAKRIVICNGTIESTRLLLELFNKKDSKPKDLGHYLSDHVSISVGKAYDTQKGDIRSKFGPRFEGKTMRTFRFLPDKPLLKGGFFINFLFDYKCNPGFELLNGVFSFLQGQREGFKVPIKKIIPSLYGLTRLVYERYFLSKLYIPKKSS